jgi:plastocyanin
MQKVEGNVQFHTARSTAFPQPAPGTAAGPGPMRVPADTVRSMLGVSSVVLRPHTRELAISETVLGAEAQTVSISNFTFAPTAMTVRAGQQVTWLNDDDAPHTVVGTDPGSPLKSPALDTGDKYSVTLTRPGTYRYFCSLHPHMTGSINVT